MKPLYVIGHKNPDCDAIVSAIACAQLKYLQNIPAEACACGNANSETQYLLKRFGFEHPRIIHSARCTLSEIAKDEALTAGREMTMKAALDYVMSKKNKGIFVVDEDGKLEGIVSVSDLTRLFTESPEYTSDLLKLAPLGNIVDVLEARSYYENPDFHTNGVVHIMPSLSDAPSDYTDSIVIVRNNPDIQRFAIECRAALLVISGENWVDKVTMEKARENGVSVIRTAKRVTEVARQICLAPSIRTIMTKGVTTFQEDETVEEVSAKIAMTRFRTYPVLDKEGRPVAAISRYHLFHYEKKQFVLVDHNEETQSVNDIESAVVTEIIDHHRLGGIETVNPISITARPVGSTSTIIAGLYRQNRIEISPRLAGLLLGGVVNDTLCLLSPTTTDEDRETASYLSMLAGITPEKLNEEMIAASDSIVNKTDLELLYDDFKEFRIGESRIAIAQNPCKSEEDFLAVKDRFANYVAEAVRTQHYDLILTLFTDPAGSGSYFIYSGKKSHVIPEGFSGLLEENGFARQIISRKKQVLPIIIDTMNHQL